MAVQKVLKATREIISSEEYSKYSSEELADTFKGKVVIINPEQSEIAKNLKINKKGTYAIKLG